MARHPNTATPIHKGAKPTRAPARRGAVLHLCPTMEAEDPARELVDFAITAHRAGWPSIIASGGGALAAEAERAAVQHRTVLFNRHARLFNVWRNRRKLDSIIQHDNPILIHAHGATTLPYAAWAARQHHLPLVADVLHPIPETAEGHKLFADLLQLPTVFRVPSEFMGHHLHGLWKVPAERIYHIPSGINLQWFSTSHVSPERLSTLSRAWRLPEQGSIILVPLPLTHGMGHDVLLEALAALKNDNVFTVLMGREPLGSSVQRHEIEHTIRSLGLSGKVVMPENCADWPSALWHASAVVAPNSLPRGENRLLLAAQAMGRPVIVSDVGANRELVDSEAAWIIPPNNIPALDTALRQAVGLDVNHRLGLAERARDFIAAQFPQQSWLDDTLTMYQDVMTTAQQNRKRVA